MEFENEIFELISHTGEARANIFNSLEEAKNKDNNKSNELMKLADEQMVIAHNMQTKLIQKDISNGGIQVSLLMVHAQDQLMTAMSEQYLVKKMIEMYEVINELEGKINE